MRAGCVRLHAQWMLRLGSGGLKVGKESAHTHTHKHARARTVIAHVIQEHSIALCGFGAG